MDEDVTRWQGLHSRAAAAYARAAQAAGDPGAPTPSGSWTVADVLAHVREESASAPAPPELPTRTLDLAVHAWDLSRARGADPGLDDELCEALLQAFSPYTHLMAEEDAFAPPIPVGPGASPQERLVALCGRDPAWQARESPSAAAEQDRDEERIEVERLVPAPLSAVWEMLVDPALHHRFDDTEMVGLPEAAERLARVGQVFTMRMTYRSGEHAEHYSTANHVVELAEREAVAWETGLVDGERLGWTWRYSLRPDPNGTLVTLGHDWSGSSDENRAGYGVPMVDAHGLARSLALLEAALAADDNPPA